MKKVLYYRPEISSVLMKLYVFVLDSTNFGFLTKTNKTDTHLTLCSFTTVHISLLQTKLNFMNFFRFIKATSFV